MTHTNNRCPNCGRSLAEEEVYCYFCEMDAIKLKKIKKWGKTSAKK